MNQQAFPAAPTSREKILHALYEAAELEQNLMCTYLYAAFSLKDGEGEGLDAAEADAVARWRRAIIDVAIDEMGHLVAVWNVTSALGGAPRFGRANFPLDAGLLPGGVVVKLAPFSEAVVQHFVHLERPEGSDEPDGAGFAVAQSTTRTPIAPRLTPAGYDYDTVGIFYQTIGANLRALVERIGERATFCGNPALQLSPAEVDIDGARRVDGLQAALAAFDTIILQGEGAPAHSEGSHFERFRQIRAEFRALRARNPMFVPAHPSAHNPVLRKPPRPEGRVWLEDADAVATVDLANAAYGLTLRLLAAAYTLESPDGEKVLYVDVAISLMRVLTLLAERAARLPAGPSNPGCNAGVSFTALRDAASLPPGASARAFYVERLGEIVAAAEALDQRDRRCASATKLVQALAARLRDAPPPAVPKAAGAAAAGAAANEPAVGPVVSTVADGIEVAEGLQITVLFDDKRCIHARFCVTRAPATFLANVEGPWIKPDATALEELAAVIRDCPSGALSYRRKDGDDEAAPPVNLLALRENGPYALRAAIAIDGTRAGYRATLCRCGASRNKPFCDKSHLAAGFVATGEPPTRDGAALEDRGGPLQIAPEVDGPLMVWGNLEIVSGTGRTVVRTATARLCRCGGSATKPFCDNTHRTNGFRSG
jgi:CDGSH-type Zn-finger protein/uncharacterized Fe-S cluster protein YjdI